MDSFNAVSFGTDILKYMSIGRWIIELEDGKPPRMYCDETMCSLLGVKNNLSPEENYRVWYYSIDPEHVDNVNEAVATLAKREFAAVEYPWYHPTRGRIYVRCSGIRDTEYKEGIRLEGLHREITAQVLKDTKNQQTLKEDLQAIQGLASEYNVLHFLNVKTDEYTSYFFDPNSPEEAVRLNNSSKNYYEAHNESIPVFCHPDYMDSIMRYGNKDYLVNALRHRKKIVERFLCMNKDGDYLWTDFILLKFDPIDAEPTRVAVGYVVVDEEQKEKMAQQKALEEAMHAAEQALKERDAQLHNLKALAGLYFSMHLIDLVSDSVEEISSDEILRPFFVSDMPASELMRTVVSNMIVTEYGEAALQFTDLTTLADRMKGLKTLSSEFVSTITGWFIANFVSVEVDENGRPTKVLFTTQTIDAQKKREEGLFLRSMTDEMTKLFNRTAYEEELDKYRHCEIEDDFVLIALDVNRLKYTNDNYGHAAGDEIICALAECMRKAFGADGKKAGQESGQTEQEERAPGYKSKLFRIGGDEFIAILRASQEQLQLLEEEFRAAVDGWSGKLVKKLEVSYGVVTGREAKRAFVDGEAAESGDGNGEATGNQIGDDLGGEMIDRITRLADQRMYEAKDRYYASNGFDRRKH